MRLLTGTAAAAGLGMLLLSCATTPSLPDTYDVMSWTFQSKDPYAVQLEFQSQHRDVAWPGGGRAYDLDDSDEHTFELRCRTGEKICYAAWVKGGNGFWGVGPDGDEGCDDCCRRCDTMNAGTVVLWP